MNIEEILKIKIQNALKELGVDLSLDEIVIDHSKDKAHGDFATTVALRLAKQLHNSPANIANELVKHIDMSDIDKIEIAGPGFINFFVKSSSLSNIIKTIIDEDKNYGRAPRNNTRINVEFVSANPTGNLHLGHARCAAIGDSICRLYDAAGYDVSREFYVNDAGSQIDHLRDSIKARYHTLLGDPMEVPEDGYLGEDIIDIAKIMIKEVGDKYLQDSEEANLYFRNKGMELELEKIKKDLNLFRVNFDIYSFESDVRKNGAVEKTIEDYKDYVYEQEGALFLRTTDFLDDKDRAIRKSNGDYTYFMPDIVYHLNKLSRHYDYLIDILGADHHGYINRMKSALMMKGYSKDTLEVELVQVVRLIKDGLEVKMSKRTGNAVTLRELCEEVGVDAVRYFFVERAASSHLDFNLDLALKKTSDNPMYYAQYAYARLISVLEKNQNVELNIKGDRLDKQQEVDLLKYMIEFPNVVLASAKERNPSKIAKYANTLASLIHSFYTECRIMSDDLELSASRLALSKAASIVMENALNIIGVSSPKQM